MFKVERPRAPGRHFKIYEAQMSENLNLTQERTWVLYLQQVSCVVQEGRTRNFGAKNIGELQRFASLFISQKQIFKKNVQCFFSK